MNEDITLELALLGERVDADTESISVPSTYRNITERIVAHWEEEKNKKISEWEYFAGLNFFSRYFALFKDNWFGSNVSDSYFALVVAAFFLSLICIFPVWFFGPWSFFGLWIPCFLFLLPVFFFGVPFFQSVFARSRYRADKIEGENELNKKMMKLGSDPVFLLEKLSINLNIEIKSYRARLTELQARFKNAVVEPREEVKKRFEQYVVDRDKILALSLEELPEREEILEKIQARIAQSEKLLSEKSPEEEKLLQKFVEVETHIGLLQDGVNGLIARKAKYEERAEVLNRVRGYDVLGGESFEDVLEGRRLRELAEIENTLSGLNQEVFLTHRGLEEVLVSLPANDSYQLTAQLPRELIV